MPQLDLSTYPSQLFWLTITFLFLYLVLARFIVPRLAGILEGRQSRIDEDLAAAARFREEAEAARLGYEKSLQETRLQAQAIVAEAQAKAGAEGAARIGALDADMAKRLSDAQAAIATARTAALAQMGPAAGELVSAIVERIAHVKPTNEQVSTIVNDILRGKGA